MRPPKRRLARELEKAAVRATELALAGEHPGGQRTYGDPPPPPPGPPAPPLP